MKVNVLTASGGMLDLLVAWAKLGHQQRTNKRNVSVPGAWSDSDILVWAMENKPTLRSVEDPIVRTLIKETLTEGQVNIMSGGQDGWTLAFGSGENAQVFKSNSKTVAWLRCYVFISVGGATVELPEYFTGRVPT